jgi:hypothetical protein
LVCLSILLFPNSYIILFWEFHFLPFCLHAQTSIIYLTLLSLLYSGTSIYRFSRGWRKQTMNAEKRSIRETTFFLTKKVVHCLLLLGGILPQLKIWIFET